MTRAVAGLLPNVPEPTVALVDWSQLLEDFLDSIGVTFAQFRDEVSGGWMFGYVDALQRAGVRTVLVCVSARVSRVERHAHAATGATICVIPASRAYRALRRRVLNPYAPTALEACGSVGPGARLACGALRNLAPYLSTPAWPLARELARERCGAVLCQDYEHGRLDVCLAVGRLLGAPVFATFQGGDHSLTRLERLVRGPALRAAAGLVIAPRREAERVRRRYGVAERAVARVFNPLDLAVWRGAAGGGQAAARASLGIPAGAGVLAWHGRVEIARKGLDVLLDAWGRVCRARPGRDLRLLLVGSGNDDAELARRLAADADLRGVSWRREYVRDRAVIRDHLAAADVWALTSRHEGFPVAPVEAMACALPVVAVDAPGVPDILEGGPDATGGVVVAQGDAAALAAEVGRLLDDPTLARARGRVAQARAERAFAPEHVGAQLRGFLFPHPPPPTRRA